MSYQIKSTPFFRRIVSTSKKNGQLQKLKEEYERIRDFNERSIEIKMRQVRLKRLFREIEELKKGSTTSVKRRRVGSDKNKTQDEKRYETFIKARELGKEFSRVNALMVDRRMEGSFYSQSSTAIGRIDKSAEEDKKLGTARRISYGNEISLNNKQKLQRTSKKRAQKRTQENFEAIALADDEKKTKLKQRLEYGNSRSSINMAKIPKRHAKHKVATEKEASGRHKKKQEEMQKVTLLVPLQAMPSKLSTLLEDTPQELTSIFQAGEEKKEPRQSEPPVFKTFEQLQYSKIRVNSSSQMPKQETVRQRAKRFWRKLSLTVRSRVDRASSPRAKPSAHLHKVQQREFQLRTISNDTYLPDSKLSKQTDPPQLEDLLSGDEGDDGDEGDADEVLINFELFANDSEAKEAKHRERPKDIVEPNNSKGGLVIISDNGKDNVGAKQEHAIVQKVQRYVKLFEPYVREIAEKEAYEAFGVQRLRSIFEQQIN